MAIKEFPNVSPDANATFGLEENTTEFNSVLTKTAQHMTLPGAKWRGSVSFTNRSRQEANKVKAFKAALGGKAGRFHLTPFDAYQNGTMSGIGVIDGAVASGSSILPTKGWAADQNTLFEYGDYLEANGELKMVVGDVPAPQSYIEYTGTNYMPSPFDPSGWYGATEEGDILENQVLENPSGSAFIGYAEQTEVDQFVLADNTSPLNNTFPVVAGDKVRQIIIIKSAGGTQPLVRFRFGDSQGFLADMYYDVLNSGISIGTGTATELGNGFYLVETIYEATRDDAAFNCRVFMWADFVNTAEPSGAAPIGSKLYVQAAYAGVSGFSPVSYLATADIPIAPPLRKALAGGEAITTTDPKGVFYLGSDSQEWSINVNGVQDMGFDFIEDVN